MPYAKIDAHHHLWKHSAPQYPWISENMGLLLRDLLIQDLRRTHPSSPEAEAKRPFWEFAAHLIRGGLELSLIRCRCLRPHGFFMTAGKSPRLWGHHYGIANRSLGKHLAAGIDVH